MASYPRRAKITRKTLPAETHTMAVGISLAENPNRGKRHAARMAGVETIAPRYIPLTVHTPIRRARIAPLTTSYTI